MNFRAHVSHFLRGGSGFCVLSWDLSFLLRFVTSPNLPNLCSVLLPDFALPGFVDDPWPRPQTKGPDELEMLMLVRLIYRDELEIVLYRGVWALNPLSTPCFLYSLLLEWHLQHIHNCGEFCAEPPWPEGAAFPSVWSGNCISSDLFRICGQVWVLITQIRRAATCEVFLLSFNNADWGKFSLIFVLSTGEGEEWPSQGWHKQELQERRGKKTVEVGPGGAFSAPQQEFLNFESGVGHWWPLVTQGHEGEQLRLCLQGAADEENFRWSSWWVPAPWQIEASPSFISISNGEIEI